MTDTIVPVTTKVRPHGRRNAFFLMVLGVIAAALVLVSISLTLYVSNGTSQLDLSRPGYQDVGKQAYQTRELAPFSDSGPLDKDAVNHFLELYDKEQKKITSTPSFSGDPIGTVIPAAGDENVQQ